MCVSTIFLATSLPPTLTRACSITVALCWTSRFWCDTRNCRISPQSFACVVNIAIYLARIRWALKPRTWNKWISYTILEVYASVRNILKYKNRYKWFETSRNENHQKKYRIFLKLSSIEDEKGAFGLISQYSISCLGLGLGFGVLSCYLGTVTLLTVNLVLSI